MTGYKIPIPIAGAVAAAIGVIAATLVTLVITVEDFLQFTRHSCVHKPNGLLDSALHGCLDWGEVIGIWIGFTLVSVAGFLIVLLFFSVVWNSVFFWMKKKDVDS